MSEFETFDETSSKLSKEIIIMIVAIIVVVIALFLKFSIVSSEGKAVYNKQMDAYIYNAKVLEESFKDETPKLVSLAIKEVTFTQDESDAWKSNEFKFSSSKKADLKKGEELTKDLELLRASFTEAKQAQEALNYHKKASAFMDLWKDMKIKYDGYDYNLSLY
ncbi:MAG: hypothetical protein RR929_00385 [Erysipelotrichaceae bacterium]